jgi:hypothetical protein
MKPEKMYLGDAVYAEADDFGGVILTTEDGIRATNRIVLEDWVVNQLQAYFQHMQDARLAAETQAKAEETALDG